MTTIYSSDKIGSVDWYAEAERIGAGVSNIDDARKRALVGHYMACPAGRGTGLRYIANVNDVPHDPEGFEYEVRRVYALGLDGPDVTPAFVDSSRPAQMKPRSIGGKAKLLIMTMGQMRQILVEKFGDAATDEVRPAAADDAVQDPATLLRMLLAEVKGLRQTVEQLTRSLGFDSNGQRTIPGVAK